MLHKQNLSRVVVIESQEMVMEFLFLQSMWEPGIKKEFACNLFKFFPLYTLSEA